MLNYRPAAEVWIDSVQEMLFPEQGIMLPWWPGFNSISGGLRPKEVTLLCAPTGAGKTQLLANISAQIAMQEIPHFVAPVETGDADYLKRMISAVEKKDLNDGNSVNANLVSTLTAKHAKLLSSHMLISTHDNRVAVNDMVTTLIYMNQVHGCKVALLDNLNFFLDVVSSAMEKAEMDNAIHEFVMLVKKIPIHIILVLHPRKTDDGRVSSEFDAKGSSTAVQECANFIAFNRPEDKDVRDDIKHFTDRELVFFKLRKRGINVRKPVWFCFNSGRFQEFQEAK